MKMNLFCFLLVTLLSCSKSHPVTVPPVTPPDSTKTKTTNTDSIPQQNGTPFAAVADPRDVSIYQVNIRAFSSPHNLQGVSKRLDQIKALGVNTIYLMPVNPVGTLKAANSPYCIRNFDSVGTEYGTLTDLRNFVDGAHSRNMAVILGFIVNQTSWVHPWITQHQDWSVHDVNEKNKQLSTYTANSPKNSSIPAKRTTIIRSMLTWIYKANI